MSTADKPSAKVVVATPTPRETEYASVLALMDMETMNRPLAERISKWPEWPRSQLFPEIEE